MIIYAMNADWFIKPLWFVLFVALAAGVAIDSFANGHLFAGTVFSIFMISFVAFVLRDTNQRHS